MVALESVVASVVRAPTIAPGELQLFETAYRAPGRPVIIKGGASDWKAMTKWTFDWMRETFGSIPVPIAVGARLERVFQKMLMREFIDRIRDPECSPPLYLRQFPFRLFFQEMKGDFVPPPYCPADRRHIMNLWLGSANTIQPFHKDNHDAYNLVENIFAQIIGRKKVYLISSKYDDCMYRRVAAQSDYHFSDVDVDNIDLEKHPRFAEVEIVQADLEPGDMVYIPRDTWHYVRALDPSLSVSTWWTPAYIFDIINNFTDPEAIALVIKEKAGSVTPQHIEEVGGVSAFNELMHSGKRDLRPHFRDLLNDDARNLMEAFCDA